MLFGLDPNDDYIQHYRIREGRLIQRPGEIMLGRFAANSLKKGVGESVRLGGAPTRLWAYTRMAQPMKTRAARCS